MKRNKGITLIALVITIIVLLLLAGISISMLAGNNSILNRASQGKSSNVLGTAKDVVNLAVMAAVQDYYQSIYDGQNVSTTYTATNLDNYIVTNVKKNNTENNEYNLEVTDVEFGNWKNKKITLKYLPDGSIVKGTLNNGVMTWGSIDNAGQDPTISEELDATEIAAAPTTYFGMDVIGYKTNQRVKATTSAQDAENPDECKTIEWQLFYAGKIDDTDTTEKNHIYLIAKDCVENDYLPTKDGVRPPKHASSDKKIIFGSSTSNGIMTKYDGSSNITDQRMKKLNKEYLITKNYSSSNGDFKAIAYLLDYQIWNNVYGSSNSEYVIGGPTIELLLKAYNKYNNQGNLYQCKVSGTNGYQISKNNGTNWANEYWGMMSGCYYGKWVQDTNSSYGLAGYWVASPNYSYNADLISVESDKIGLYGYWGNKTNANGLGIRPIVCLNENVELQEVTIGGKQVLQIVE